MEGEREGERNRERSREREGERERERREIRDERDTKSVALTQPFTPPVLNTFLETVYM